jgi:hypothetical protein
MMPRWLRHQAMAGGAVRVDGDERAAAVDPEALGRRLRHELGSLSPTERRLVAAAADSFFPPGGPIPLSGCDAQVVEYFERYMAGADPLQQVLMRLLLVFTEMSPLLFGPQRRRFTQLAHPQRLAFLDGAFVSAIYFRRVSFVSLRALLTMAYLANERVARRMGMVPDLDPFGVGARRQRQQQPTPSRAAEAP